jgi:lipopolysaccharide export LptBFGC system permease protein LptF
VGPTLFRYIFFDLVKVFLLAAGALAGILSFAGLMRPLTEYGLGPAEAVRTLFWLLPAMLTYSVPVSALFATTFVYGRLSADNESTAMKAAGIAASPVGLLMPATVLSALLGSGTIGLLCFLVPAANLQVEQTVWSNLAKLAANEVNRKNRMPPLESDAGALTIFAERAVLPTTDELDAARLALPPGVGDAGGLGLSGDVQVLQLHNVSVLGYEPASRGENLFVPGEVFSARRATVYIDPPDFARRDSLGGLLGLAGAFESSALALDQYAVTVVLEDGITFPRRLASDPGGEPAGPQPVVAAARSTQIGPILRDTPLRLNPKFMDVRELRGLLERPEASRRILNIVRTFVADDQRWGLLGRIDKQARSQGAARFEGPDGERFRLELGGRGEAAAGGMTYQQVPVRLEQVRPLPDGGRERVEVEAESLRLDVEPLVPGQGRGIMALVSFTIEDATVRIDDGPPLAGRSIERRVIVPMPEDLSALSSLTAADYLAGDARQLGGGRLTDGDARYLLQKLSWQSASVVGELHARAAFIAACTLLPMLGAGLGLLFRSGNFLTSFALSLIPAAVCIVLIVAGQQVVEDERTPSDALVENRELVPPSTLGLSLIWSGNAAVTLLGGTLLWRLRQR